MVTMLLRQPRIGGASPAPKQCGKDDCYSPIINAEKFMEMVLTAVFEEVSESEGGGYVAYVEELPGAISEGDTLGEARENLRDAISLLLEANRELAKPAHGKRITRESIKVVA
jgi:predicted RNase H-like HicB family nuclease